MCEGECKSSVGCVGNDDRAGREECVGHKGTNRPNKAKGRGGKGRSPKLCEDRGGQKEAKRVPGKEGEGVGATSPSLQSCRGSVSQARKGPTVPPPVGLRGQGGKWEIGRKGAVCRGKGWEEKRMGHREGIRHGANTGQGDRGLGKGTIGEEKNNWEWEWAMEGGWGQRSLSLSVLLSG